ncbi:aldehyde oxidase [Spirochaetia bacterium]|nr:aldehyde oxidase [Spirochaetia bacterium]
MDSRSFLEDISFRSMLCALIIRSPVARGRLQSIECPKMISSYSLITAKDIPGLNQLGTSSTGSPLELSIPILAEDALSYIGEPVAILTGPDPAKLEKYAEQCRVLCSGEAPVFSSHNVTPDMILGERRITRGDTENAFARAKTIVSGNYKTGIQEHLYAEPVGAVVEYVSGKAEDGENPGFIIHTATQWPFHVRRSAAGVLGIPESQIVIEPSLIALHMDGKIWYPSLAASQAALAAFITRKPVKLILTREEDFRYSPKRNDSEIQIRSALGEEGELLATEINLGINLGAYGVFTDEILDQSCIGSLGSYTLDNVALSGTALRTNIPPQGPFAGFGMAQGFFAMERHISRIADTLRQDPAEWRKNMHLNRNGVFAFGLPLRENPSIDQLLDTVASMSDYYRKWASFELLRHHRQEQHGFERGEPWGEPLRGIGIASAWQGNGFLYAGSDRGAYSVELTLEKDGSLEIRTSMVTSNDDYSHIWGNIASEILSIDAGKVRVLSRNSSQSPDSGPASLSRNVTILTKLVERCCLAIRKQRFRDPLPITVQRSSRPLRNPGLEEMFPVPGGKLLDAGSLSQLSWGTAVVEVEIDPTEYAPKIRGAWLGIDGGKILSETRARRSIKASCVQALGWASRERLEYVEGRITRDQIDAYNIPRPADIPPIHIDFLWNDTVDPKGIGELPFSCIPAAYVQAVSQAMDHPFESIPLGAQEVWEAGKLRKREAAIPS